MGRMFASATFGSLVLVFGVSAWAQGEVSQEVPGHGKINWTDKTITATGSGAPSLKAKNVAVARLGAERAAKMDAFRNVLEAVKGAKISGNQTAGAAMAGSSQLKAKVEGVVRGFKVLDTKYYSDGGVDLIVQVPLSGISDALIADAGSSVGAGAAGDVTGIIVNAKGIAVSPGMAPRLFDDKGTEVYGASKVESAAMKQGGVAGYTSSMDQAMKDARVAGKPMVLKAAKVTKKGSADLVLSAADAQKVAKLGSLLAKGKVIIVTD